MQLERHPFGRRERAQHDKQRHPHRVGKQRLVLGVAAHFAADSGLRQRTAKRLLPPGRTRSQHVQAHPGHDGGQPPTEVLDIAGVRPAQPQPGLLHGIVGLAQRTEHSQRDRLKVSSLLLEPLGRSVGLVHRQSLRCHAS